MKTNDEILEELTSCTIEEDADLDVKENFYYKYEDVIKAMNEALKQANGAEQKASTCNLQNVTRSFLVNQTTCEYNTELLSDHGWEGEYKKNRICTIEEYFKQWNIQDVDGDRYTVKVSLRQCENFCHTYINEQWVGRSLTIADAERIVDAIKTSCK